MRHNHVYHFIDTEFIDEVEESVDSDGALSISGGLNSPWKVNMDSLKEFVSGI